MIDPDLFVTGCDVEFIKIWKIRELDDKFTLEMVKLVSGKH